MPEPKWWTYIRETAGTEVGKVIAEAAGISEPQVSRWKSGKNKPDADKLVQFARHYNRPPIEALIAAGFLEPGDVDQVVEVRLPVSGIGDAELAAEVQRRMESMSTHRKFFDILREGAPLKIGPIDSGAAIALLKDSDGADIAVLYLPTSASVVDFRSDPSIEPGIPYPISEEADNDVEESSATTAGSGEEDSKQKTRAARGRRRKLVVNDTELGPNLDDVLIEDNPPIVDPIRRSQQDG